MKSIKMIAQRMRRRLKQRPDTEHAQIIIRGLVSASIAAYIISFDDSARAMFTVSVAVFISFFLSPLMLWHLLRDNKVNKIRRGLAVAIDGILLPIAIIGGGETTMAFISFVIWTTISHGFRFGPKYLQASFILGTITTIIAIALDPLWRGNETIAITLGLGLISLPIYFAHVLKRWEKANSQLQIAARHDHLTALPNRLGLQEFFQEEIEKGHAVAILAIDLDGFKSVNDSYGHAAGDRLLALAAERIRFETGALGRAFRLGGDEFVVVMCGAASQMHILANEMGLRLIKSLAAPFDLGAVKSAIAGSIGITVGEPGQEASQALLDEADQALYLSKTTKKGNALWFTKALRDKANRRAKLEQKLRMTIASDQIDLHFQPQFDAIHRHIVGVEALARWNDPELGDIEPREFIAIAEQAGLAQLMGKQLRFAACRTVAAWPGHPHELSLSVNMSVPELMQTDIVEQISECLVTTGLAPERLELEITEAKATDERVLEQLHAIREFGVHISISNFGGSALSFSSIRQLPFDRLKLDKRLVQDMADDLGARSIAFAIIELARSFDKLIIAEGVESEAQAVFLTERGCERLQGFHLAHPQPASEIIERYILDREDDAVSDLANKAPDLNERHVSMAG